MYVSITFPAITNRDESSPLSLWQVSLDASSSQAQSFDLAVDEDEEVTIWSIQLPSNGEEAHRLLANQSETINRRQVTADFIGQFLQQFGSRPQPFAIDETSTPLAEETILWQQLTRETPEHGITYGLRDSISSLVEGREIAEELQHFLAQTVYVLRPSLTIISEQEQLILAQTIVRTTGKMETIWRHDIQTEQKRLHQESVKLTLETRHAILLFLSQIATGTAVLALRFSVTQLLALPAVFRFACKIIQQAKEDQLIERIRQLSPTNL